MTPRCEIQLMSIAHVWRQGGAEYIKASKDKLVPLSSFFSLGVKPLELCKLKGQRLPDVCDKVFICPFTSRRSGLGYYGGPRNPEETFPVWFFRLWVWVLIWTRAEIVLAQACSERQSAVGCFILISGSIININKTKRLFIDRLSLVWKPGWLAFGKYHLHKYHREPPLR